MAMNGLKQLSVLFAPTACSRQAQRGPALDHGLDLVPPVLHPAPANLRWTGTDQRHAKRRNDRWARLLSTSNWIPLLFSSLSGPECGSELNGASSRPTEPFEQFALYPHRGSHEGGERIRCDQTAGQIMKRDARATTVLPVPDALLESWGPLNLRVMSGACDGSSHTIQSSTGPVRLH